MGIRLNGQTTGYVQIEAPATAADNTLKLPNGNGSNGQMLTTDGNGNLSFTTPASTDLITDPTPQLGGDLDVDGNDIVSTNNGDIDLDPNGSGQVVFKGNTTRGSGAVKLNCEFNSHGILVKGPPHSAGANYTLTLPNNTGTSGQLLSTDGLGTTSWTTVDASPSYQATADGALTNGQAVIVQSDGTVKAAQEIITAKNPVDRNDYNDFFTGSIEDCDCIYDPYAGRFLIVYHDHTNSELRGICCTPNGTSFTFGSAFTIDTTLPFSQSTTLGYDSGANRAVVIYSNSSSLYARVIEVSTSSNTATVGARLTIEGSNYNTNNTTMTYDATAQKMIIAYKAYGYCQIVTGTVNAAANTITVGSMAQINTADPAAVAYDANAGKTVAFYADSAGSPAYAGKAVVLNISGTSITYNTPVGIGSEAPLYPVGIYDSNAQKTVFCFQDNADSNAGKAVTVSISGTTPSFGTVLEYSTNGTRNCLAYDSNSNRVLVSFRNEAGSNTANVTPLTVSGTSITAGTTQSITYSNAIGDKFRGIAYDPVNKVGLSVSEEDSTNRGQYSQFVSASGATNLTTDNFIGFSNGAYSNGATATIQIVGAVDDAQSGLTPGEKYYVLNDGSLGTAAATPSVFAGTAVAATKLIVKG